MAPLVPYVYNATVVRVVDADTLVLDLDLGFGMWRLHCDDLPVSFRLDGCNAWEKSSPAVGPPGTT